MLLEETLSIVLALATLLAVWLGGDRMRTSTKRRLQELESSRKLLETHAASLEAVLCEPDVSDDLKVRLIRFSDRMSQRSFVEQFSGLVARRAAQLGVPGRQVEDDEDGLSNLPEEVRNAYYLAFVTGAFGAMLRWPECARNFREGLFDEVTSGVIGRSGGSRPPLAKWIAEVW